MEEQDIMPMQVERTIAWIEAVVDEHGRRLTALENSQSDIRVTLHNIAAMIARLEARLDGFRQWQSLVWALMGLLLGGLVTAGFELLKR